jgi:hypothetical protein
LATFHIREKERLPACRRWMGNRTTVGQTVGFGWSNRKRPAT